MNDTSVAEANRLLSAHALAAVRLSAWNGTDGAASFEVFHCEWPGQVFGTLVFQDVRYLQFPAATSWGYALRIAAPTAALPSRGDVDGADVVFEFFAVDAKEPSAFVIAQSMRCEPGRV